MKRTKALALIPFLVLAQQACGGESEDGAANGGPASTVSSGLPPQKTLDTLTDADAQRMCEELARTSAAVFTPEQLCTMTGALFAVSVDATGATTIDRATCEQLRDACLEQPPQGTSTDCSTATTAGFEGCTATIQEYEACMSASFRSAETTLAGLSCTEPPDQAIIAVDPQNPQQVPECNALMQECPTLFQGGGTVEPPPPGEPGCHETCGFAQDGECDDGGPGSTWDACDLGTDCTDCGPR